MREIPDEFIVFIPQPIWIDDTYSRESEVEFLQMCASDDLMRVEIRVGVDEPCKMYAHYCDKEEAVSIMENMFRDSKCPDVRKWQDVTDEIFGEKEIERRKREEEAREDADKINNAGWDIHKGLTSGVPDPDGAVPYYEKAAALGCSHAMVNLGNVYEDKSDYEHAYYWYHEAALAGNEAGMFNLANMYHWGWYVKQDYQKAYEYFQTLYHKFCHGAAFYLGLYSEYGYVGEKDYRAAIQYYQSGLDDDDEYCAVNLGRMYCMGLGVKKNYRKGYKLFLRGYKAGDELACCCLGYCKGCNTKLSSGSSIAVTGHKWKEATYEAPKTCMVCGKTEGQPLPRIAVGDYITYGHYEQDNNTANGKEPIEWQVLDVDMSNNRALVISRYGLDAHRFDANEYQGWANSEIHSWLNSTFLNNAFTTKEQEAIVTTRISTPNYNGNSGGSDTEDKLWLLSRDEATTYFKNAEARKSIPTKYAVAQGAYQYSHSPNGRDIGSLNGTGCC